MSTAAVLSGRVPLISFPQRRGQRKGQSEQSNHFSQLIFSIALSVEHFQQSQPPPPPVSSHPVAAASTRDSNFITIDPTMFGRLPLSLEEVELINVRKYVREKAEI